MSRAANPLVRIPVGVVVERRKAVTQWADYLWLPVAVLPGEPEARPWTPFSSEGDVTRFYAGAAEIELYRSEAVNYRANLASGAPALWVVMVAGGGEAPREIVTVTADPAEGEACTETTDNLVEQVPMPDAIRAVVEAFVAEHLVEQPFVKRKRDRANPEALARHGIVDEDKE